jgi:signal transduction histidine kinase
MEISQRQDRVNILLVDDQPAKLLSYELILADLGENVIKASSAREALEHLLKVDVVVLLVDVCMPELDGFELAEMVRGHPRFEKTAIIFVSAIQITELDRLRGYAAGAVDYVPVPVVPEVLRAKVKVFAELYRKTRQLEQLNSELERRVADRTAALEDTTQKLQRLNEDLERRIEERTREREHALAQLFEAQKLDTIGQLTGGVAHDFNNLLMAALGSLELLRKRVASDQRAMQLLDTAVDAAQRGASLTQRLLAFARRQELKPSSVSLRALFDGMTELLQRAIGPKITINRHLPANLPPIKIDPNQLELAILNVALNARDAMPAGGTLSIEAESARVGDDWQEPRLGPGHYVRLRLVDAGTGMDATTLARATEPFFTTKGIGKGTGLGLSMVHGLAVQSGGGMRICSKLSQGTTIELWLPEADAVTEPNARAAPKFSEALIGVPPMRVMVVDDDSLVRVSTAALIEDLGHTVIEVSSADAALRSIRRNPHVDLVITDQAMPGMSGLELAEKIAAEFPAIKVILACSPSHQTLSTGGVGTHHCQRGEVARPWPTFSARWRTVSWLTMMPRAASSSSIMRKLGGQRK